MSFDPADGIEIRAYSLEEVRVRLKATDGSEFIMDVTTDGLKFYGSESSAGQSHEKPIVKSVDDLWRWIKHDGDRVSIKDRAEVKRSRNR